MTGGAARPVYPKTLANPPWSVIVITLLCLSTASQGITASAEQRIESDDFQILDDLETVLEMDRSIRSDTQAENSAGDSLNLVRESVTESNPDSPIEGVDNVFSDTSLIETMPPEVRHPRPYEILTNPDEAPPGEVRNIWSTILNITDYAIWIEYEDTDGQTRQSIELVTFGDSLLSLIFNSGEPFLHPMDVDGDGNDDIEVGLTLEFDFNGGWGISGDRLWIKPTIQFKIEVIEEETPVDPAWENLQNIEIALVKAFAYSDTFGVNQGESYVWIIDTVFTQPPRQFALDVGIERIFLDISDASSEFIAALTFGIFNPNGDASESGISIASLSAPYVISINNPIEDQCPDRYDPSELSTLPSMDISCGIRAGFGYIHYSPPDQSQREIWEVAYIDLAVHPEKQELNIPKEVSVTIRTDSALASGAGGVGEKSLTSLEYYADRGADIHLHFHEDRVNVPKDKADGDHGNSTDSVGWLRGMPAGSLAPQEIDRVFTMLGSRTSPELPGSQPERLGLIIAVKNFSRDSSPNEDNDQLPINPAFPPKSMILLRSVEEIDSLEYDSWFTRGGVVTDHQRISIETESIPTALIVYGDFNIGGGNDGNDPSFGNNENLDFLSRILDTALVNLVDLFLETALIINSVPTIVVDVLSGGVEFSPDGGGQNLHLEMTDDFRPTRTTSTLPLAHLTIGSHDHYRIEDTDHLVLSKDRLSGLVQGSDGLVEPLVPVGASIRFSHLEAIHATYDGASEERTFQLVSKSSGKLRFLFLDYHGGNLSDASTQSLTISNLPDQIDLTIGGESASYTASDDIDSFQYHASNGSQRQAVRILGIPDSFEAGFGNEIYWQTEGSISSVEAQITNSENPAVMNGDHFYYKHEAESDTSSLSTRISGLSAISWEPSENASALGGAGRSTASLKTSEATPFGIVIDHVPMIDQNNALTATVLLDPLPSDISLQIPADGNSQGSLDVPVLDRTQGVSGLAFFLGGFTDLGQSVNRLLATATSEFTSGTENVDSAFNYGIQLDSDTNFDLIVEAVQGIPPETEPPWVHGIAIHAPSEGLSLGFSTRVWIPNLPPMIDLELERRLIDEGSQWTVNLDARGWLPGAESLIIATDSIQGMDAYVTLHGLPVGMISDIDLEMVFDVTETTGSISEIDAVARYSASFPLSSIHAELLDRNVGARSELLINGVPTRVNLDASLGTAIKINMDVPEEYRDTQGRSVKSMMVQQMQWFDGAWRPATVFLSDVPGTIALTTEPGRTFDITKSLVFQGIPQLDYASSSSGMSLFIEAEGEAINQKGDVLMLAQGMADRLSIKPTQDFGLAVKSSGDGVEVLYIRITDVPAAPPVILENMEILSEDIKSATIEVHTLISQFGFFEISEVQGGRIVASARAYAEVNDDTKIDLRGVLLDAQFTNGIPTGTTFGVNGMASDLSIINSIPGVEGSTTHIVIPEPLTSAFTTVGMTVLGGFLK